MQAQEHVSVPKASEHNGALLQTVDLLQNGATRTEKLVRRYPLTTIGLALGAGVAVGVAAHHLLTPKPKRSMLERLGVIAIATAAARGFTRLF